MSIWARRIIQYGEPGASPVLPALQSWLEAGMSGAEVQSSLVVTQDRPPQTLDQSWIPRAEGSRIEQTYLLPPSHPRFGSELTQVFSVDIMFT